VDNEIKRINGQNGTDLVEHIVKETAKNLTLPEKCKEFVIEHVDVVAILNDLTRHLAMNFLEVFESF